MKSTITGTCRWIGLLMLVAAAAACGVNSQEAPSLIGPSGFAQSVTLNASPDRLARDGSSQSVVTVNVRNESGQAVAGQRLTVVSTAGTLSQTEVVTDASGRATFTLTAPSATTPAPSVIDVQVTPVGGNFDNAFTRTLAIALVGTANTTVPTPSFTATPTDPEVQQVVTFDATATTDEGAACTTTCTFAWNFGDGSTASGSMVQHAFTSAGTFIVQLTVTDSSGSSATSTQTITTAAVDAPAISAPTSTPDDPVADQAASFAVEASAASGHRIVRYFWDFGDGTTATTTDPTVAKVFAVPGTFTVSTTVTDDLGRTARASAVFNVVNPTPNPPVARFTVSPTQPRAGNETRFDASSTTVGTRAVIVRYDWNFGDGVTEATTNPTTGHVYSEGRTYAVTLTVTDNLGQTSTVGRQVVVID